jgi:hypothetical protein
VFNQHAKQVKNPLDPLLLQLSKDYTNDADLSARLQTLFKVWLPEENWRMDGEPGVG